MNRPALPDGSRLPAANALRGHAQPQAQWSGLGFQDLNDDEAFILWAFRCWQFDPTAPVLAEHRLAGLLRHDRLLELLAHLFRFFRACGADHVMAAHLLDHPRLTQHETWLLGLLGEPQELARPAPAACLEQAALCRQSLARHRAQVRTPATIARHSRGSPVPP